MKKLGLLLMLLLAMTMQSHRVFAQSVTITLMPGWNWISVPLMDTLDFETALGSFTPVAGDIIKSQWGNASYMNGQWRGQISHFYPGYGYHYKSNRTMPVFLTFTAQQPAPQVIVTTAEPTDITTNSATCGGNVASSDGNYISVLRGICWSTNPNPTFNDNYIEAGEGIGSFTVSMSDLAIGTAYYVCAYAVTADETVYGEQMSFSTRDGIPSLTTVDVSDITTTSATCGGIVADDGGLSITARGVCWSTLSNPTIADPHTSNGSGLGSFNSNITGLNLNTTYYVRAYATTDAGTAYGEEKTFTTLDGLPTLTTTEISNIGIDWVVGGGNITDDGGLNISMRGVCWSTNPSPTLNDNHTTNGTGIGGFTISIYGLTGNTTYFMRAYATTSAGTAYGNEVCFTTLEQLWNNGILPGAFSVSNNSQVYFSQGNLQYQASTNSWRFADNQYDYIGGANSNISSTNSGLIDLFGWGTSGWNNGNTYYHPFDFNTLHGNLYGPSGNHSLTGSYANADWGVYNTISNGGNTANAWRTLTSDEWYYVYFTRSTTSGIRYAKAQVNGVNGIILLPDNWDTAVYSLNNANSSNASFNSNVISAIQWISFENAGAVFLPAAGYRYGTSLYNIDSNGHYWSVSHFNDDRAYQVSFSDSYLGGSAFDRLYGQSVRLVHDTE